MKKEIFTNNFRALMGDSTREQTAEALDVSKSTIDKWLNPDDSTMPWRYLDRICAYYHCDPAELFTENIKDFSIEYKAISEITGLSSKSIEALRRLNEKDADNDAYSWKNVAIINQILEELYDKEIAGARDLPPVASVLTCIFDYTHPDDISAPDNSHSRYSAGMTKLIRSSLLDDIHSWMHIHTSRKPKDEYMKFPDPESFDKWYESKHKKDRQ